MPKHTRVVTVSASEVVAIIRKALGIPDHAKAKIEGFDVPNLTFTWDEPEPKTEPALPSQTLTSEPGWIAWQGGDNPLPGKKVQVQLGDGAISGPSWSEVWAWDRSTHQDSNIVAYRVVE